MRRGSTSDHGKLNLRKDNGLVRCLPDSHMRRLTGQMGIGHEIPYGGQSSPALAQPFYVNSPYGLSSSQR